MMEPETVWRFEMLRRFLNTEAIAYICAGKRKKFRMRLSSN
jgi:hypothetical protein